LNSSTLKPRLVAVGKIVRTHGVRGAVKIYPYGETLAALSAGAELQVGPHAGATRLLTIASLRLQGRHLLAQFAEVTDMHGAQEVVGAELLVSEQSIEPTAEGEYYHYQLLGLEVTTRAGVRLGDIKHIMTTGSNDVYVVESDGKEILVPAIADVIISVDLERGFMVVDLPEGLIDDL
jgi:16S rRNA processing protein RimM